MTLSSNAFQAPVCIFKVFEVEGCRSCCTTALRECHLLIGFVLARKLFAAFFMSGVLYALGQVLLVHTMQELVSVW